MGGRGPKPLGDDKRFWSHVDKTGDCWLWTGAIGQTGYGQFRVGQYGHAKTVHTHRWAYEQKHEPPPPGWVLHHTCNIRHCVKDAHLLPMTRKEHSSRPRGHRA